MSARRAAGAPPHPPPASPDTTPPASPDTGAFCAQDAWRLDPQVAVRDEPFGALAYHYGNRRLVFLKSRTLVELVSTLHEYPDARRRPSTRSCPSRGGRPTGGPWLGWRARR